MRNAAARRAVYVLRGVWAPSECDHLAAAAAEAAAAAGGWSRARHTSFPTPDISADALQPQAADALRRAVLERLLRPIAARCVAWPLRRDRLRSRPRRAGFDRVEDLVLRDLFIVNYEARRNALFVSALSAVAAAPEPL